MRAVRTNRWSILQRPKCEPLPVVTSAIASKKDCCDSKVFKSNSSWRQRIRQKRDVVLRTSQTIVEICELRGVADAFYFALLIIGTPRR